MPTIFCENINRKIEVPSGANLKDALLAEGVRIYKWPTNYFLCPCSSFTEIEIVEGSENLGPLTGKERKALDPVAGIRRLASCCHVQGNATIRIRPPR